MSDKIPFDDEVTKTFESGFFTPEAVLLDPDGGGPEPAVALKDDPQAYPSTRTLATLPKPNLWRRFMNWLVREEDPGAALSDADTDEEAAMARSMARAENAHHDASRFIKRREPQVLVQPANYGQEDVTVIKDLCARLTIENEGLKRQIANDATEIEVFRARNLELITENAAGHEALRLCESVYNNTLAGFRGLQAEHETLQSIAVKLAKKLKKPTKKSSKKRP